MLWFRMILAVDPRLIFPLSLTAKDATTPATAAVVSEAELLPTGGCMLWHFVALSSRCSSRALIHHCCCSSVEKDETLSLRGSKNLSVGRIGQNASSAEIKCAPAAMFSTLLCSVTRKTGRVRMGIRSVHGRQSRAIIRPNPTKPISR